MLTTYGYYAEIGYRSGKMRDPDGYLPVNRKYIGLRIPVIGEIIRENVNIIYHEKDNGHLHKQKEEKHLHKAAAGITQNCAQ